MDHPCHKCGRNIEDGKPFCGECGAPQIRVALAEAPAEAPVPTPAAGVGPAASPNDPSLVFPGISVRPLALRSSSALRPCLLAAALAVLLMFLGLNPFVAALAAGFLAVAISRRQGPGIAIRAGAGARIGALGGMLSFGMSTLLELLAAAVLHKGPELRSEMVEKFQQAATRYPGPAVQPFLEFIKTPDGFAIMMVASLIFGLVAFLVLGSLGGVVGSAVLGGRERP